MDEIQTIVTDRRPAHATGGRPSREESARRTETLIDVATALFLERGYEATAIEQVAAQAHVGKRTLYARFPDKQSLFAAVVHHVLDRWHDTTIIPQNGSLEERLTAVSRGYVELSTTREAIAFYRLLVTEMGRYPELGTLLREDVEQRGPNLLEDTLRRCLDDGLLTAEGDRAHPGWAFQMSKMLSGALLGEPRRRIIFLRQPMSPDELEAWVVGVVRLFLKGLI